MSDDTVVVDSSAYVAIARAENDAADLAIALRSFSHRLMSAATYLECALVAEGRLGGRQDLDDWLDREQIEVVPLPLAQARLGADAFVRFGKGRHAAGLNYGDCFAYALAKSLGAPLLFKGDDFARTDIDPARAV